MYERLMEMRAYLLSIAHVTNYENGAESLLYSSLVDEWPKWVREGNYKAMIDTIGDLSNQIDDLGLTNNGEIQDRLDGFLPELVELHNAKIA